jgi:hypothetical protein
MLDIIVNRKDLREMLSTIVTALLPEENNSEH